MAANDRAMTQAAGQRTARLVGAFLAIFALLLAAGLLALAAGAGSWALYLVAIAFVLAATLGWLRLTAVAERDRQLDRLVNAIEAAARSAEPKPPGFARGDLDPALARLQQAAALLVSRATPSAASQARLAAILGALPQPVIVVTRHGLVSLANQAAVELLDAEKLRTGTSVFDVIERTGLDEALAQLASGAGLETSLRLVSGEERQARLRALPDHDGTVIAFEGPAPGATGLAQALELHERPPPRQAPRPDTPLDALTVVVLDCETTGLNVGYDRLLSLAAVRLQGATLVRGEMIDVLFDPGEPIPPASTAIHGISDAMAMAAQPLAAQWDGIEPMLRDCVIVGHNIGFDLTLLETELRRADIRWQRPASLCTVQLAAALDQSLTDLNLEAVARAYGIAIAGRHTALGDALATAEVYLHLLALMRERGDRTLADAQARAATARRVVREQQAAGW
ncbi:MAG: exonuclease domain-containing protein [Reyranellaceae bacterium]